MKVMVTGGCGFVGSHLAERLIEEGKDVVVYDNLSTGRLSNVADLSRRKRFRFVRGDILDRGALTEAMKDCAEVYHLAAAVGVRVIMQEPARSIRVNTVGAQEVLQAAADCRSRVFYASSREVYGKGAAGECLREDGACVFGMPSVTRWSYACSKLMGEFSAAALHAEVGLRVITGRFFNVVGPRQLAIHGMVVPTFVEQALRGAPITVHGDGSQSRSFVDVRDVVEAVVRLMRSDDAVGGVFNIGNAQCVTIRALAERVMRITRSPSQITSVPYQTAFGPGFDDIEGGIPDLARIFRATGFVPLFDLESSIRRVVSEYEEERNSAIVRRTG